MFYFINVLFRLTHNILKPAKYASIYCGMPVSFITQEGGRKAYEIEVLSGSQNVLARQARAHVEERSPEARERTVKDRAGVVVAEDDRTHVGGCDAAEQPNVFEVGEPPVFGARHPNVFEHEEETADDALLALMPPLRARLQHEAAGIPGRAVREQQVGALLARELTRTHDGSHGRQATVSRDRRD